MIPALKGEFEFEITFLRKHEVKVKTAARRLEQHHGARYVIADDPNELPVLRGVASFAARRQVSRITRRYQVVSISGDSI